MPVKHFVINPKIERLSKEKYVELEQDKLKFVASAWDEREVKAQKALEKECTLKHVYGRVIVKVDMQAKNRHTFSNGLVIRRERNFNNFNFREVNPTNCIVISADNIKTGSEILVDYTAIHDSYRIFSYDSGSNDIQYYSLEERCCYAYKDIIGKWQPFKNYEFGLKVFEPYKGFIQGVAPTVKKDILYCLTGELAGNVILTLKGCDYCMVFTDTNGKEKNIIRFTHSEDANFDREEVILINDELTKKVHDGELLVGLTPTDSKPLNEYL